MTEIIHSSNDANVVGTRVIEAVSGQPGAGPYILLSVTVDADGICTAVSCHTHECLWAEAIGGFLSGRIRGQRRSQVAALRAIPWHVALEGFPVGRWELLELANQALAALERQWPAGMGRCRSEQDI